jgi:hypothetical protein
MRVKKNFKKRKMKEGEEEWERRGGRVRERGRKSEREGEYENPKQKESG